MHDRERTLDELRELAQRRGGYVDVAELRRSGPTGLYDRVLRLFGSIGSAREQAGLAPRRGPYKWTPERILDELRELHRTGVRLTGPALKRAHKEGVLAAAEHYFGGLPRARTAAGIAAPPFVREPPEPWTASRVVHVILERQRAGESLASSRVPAKLRTAARVYWGSWRQAVEAAGLDYAATRLVRARYDRDDLIAELLRLSREHPEMTVTQLQRTGLQQRFADAFGDLSSALEQAGIVGWPRRFRRPLLGRDETLAALRKLASAGLPLRRSLLRRQEPHLSRSIDRNFASWEQAMAAMNTGES